MNGPMIEDRLCKGRLDGATSVSSEHVGVLLHEAAAKASRLVRDLGLPGHERDDLRQELLVDLLARYKRFDPERGALGAFAGAVVRHRAMGLASRIVRERTIFVSVCSQDLSWDRDGNRLDEGVV